MDVPRVIRQAAHAGELMDRPRLVVSITASADGRVALNRSSLLIEEAAGSVWRSLHPVGAERVIAERQAQLESRYHPEAVLEGSGTFVTEPGKAPSKLPAAELDAEVLLEPYVPGGTDCRWFVVVDGRGRIRWTHKGEPAGDCWSSPARPLRPST